MGVANIAYNAGAAFLNTAAAVVTSPVTVPRAISRAAWNNPKATLFAITALGALAYAAYANRETLDKIAQDYAPALRENLSQKMSELSDYVHDLANFYGFAEARTTTETTCKDTGKFEGFLSNLNAFFEKTTVCETHTVEVNRFRPS